MAKPDSRESFFHGSIPGKNVHVPSEMGQYGLVEDAHLAICHMVTECIRVK